VPGVGPKTAADLIGQFGAVESVLARLGEIKSDRLRAALQNAAADVRRNLELVRLPQLPCEFLPEKLVVGAENRAVLAGLYEGWGFKGMLAALGAQNEEQAELI
jgi:DNA polymerase-1